MGNNTTMTKCYANVGKNRTWFQRLKGYFLDNADYLDCVEAGLVMDITDDIWNLSLIHI